MNTPAAKKLPRPRKGGASDAGSEITEARVTPSYMVETNNGGNVENVPGFDSARVLAEGFGGGRVPSRFRGDRLGSASYLEFAFPQSVCGRDDRVFIPNPTTVPWRCVCQLVIEGLHAQEVLGTGWLVGPRTLITAGHNLYSFAAKRGASRIWVLPGRSGDNVPFGYFQTNSFAVHPLWQSKGDPMHDVGAIRLPTPIGDRLGWFGYAAHTDAQLQNLVVNNAGYPADKPIGTQWFNAGRIGKVDPNVLTYGLDTEEGQSGSPVFYFTADQRRIVVAIHAYGGCPENRGIRITPALHAAITSWNQ